MIKIKQVSYEEAAEIINSIRTEVFQIEQGVPAELEFDGYDDSAIQLLAYWDNRAVATARIRFIDRHTAKIERLAVLANARRKGIAKKLMQTAIKIATDQNCLKVVVHAQSYIKSLYLQLGFMPIEQEFIEANIPHLKMIKTLKQPNIILKSFLFIF